ncbi:MAG: hypothetical protein JO336_13200 [Acidobacteriia bacterium]|nr:hypothetical protein [Terriglobia bacterium]
MGFTDWLLIGTLALAWYHVGFVWLVQVVAWPLFAYVGIKEFEAYHKAWWRGIRYILFIPSGAAFAGTILLLHWTPAGVPRWIVWTALALYILTYALTAAWWGPQQAKLIRTDTPQFRLIVETHWVRTALVSGYGAFLLAAAVLRVTG